MEDLGEGKVRGRITAGRDFILLKTLCNNMKISCIGPVGPVAGFEA